MIEFLILGALPCPRDGNTIRAAVHKYPTPPSSAGVYGCLARMETKKFVSSRPAQRHGKINLYQATPLGRDLFKLAAKNARMALENAGEIL